MDENVFNNFPVNGILPKRETGALSFLQKYPNYDGRNTLIAIFDTGVDPGAPGLQITSDSKPKIVDLIDATGAGDVDISTVRSVESSGELTGLSGRRLTIPSSWKNPSGKWYLGVKDLYELCSSTLRDRVKKERKEKLWQPSNDDALSRAQAKLNDLLTASPAKRVEPDSTTEIDGQSTDSSSKDLNELSASLNKEDLQAQVEIIKDLDGKIKDVGPVYDCIVWNDGEKWRACVDTSEKGELESCKVLTNYRDSYEYGTFSYQDMLNYSVRILPDENILQIVTDSSIALGNIVILASHGTHVASIAAGHFPDKPELNGIAPGAQIISVKIGDNRINGMETAFAIVNACRFAAEYKCDLVNFSFGEPVHYSNMGPALTAIQELVTQYGVVYCASAGNNGPGIETVGAPGGSVPEVVSVAAYVTADMIKCEHSLLGNPAAGMLFTWSSRGPQQDGQWGVSVCAPGGAFAAVPNWTQRGTQLMSGTSMASPNCTGCIALVLSGLKERGIQVTPYAVKRAIENTANPIEETVGGGAGLVQVEKAFDYLLAYNDSLLHSIHFDIKYTAKSVTYRGLYLKDDDEVNETRDYQVTVEPKFFENKSRSYTIPDRVGKDENLLTSNKFRGGLFISTLGLVWEDSENSKNWLEYPSYFYLVNSSRQFPIRIRANELEEGKVYFTHIKAVDLEDPKKPCLFKIPITVVKPYTFDTKKNLAAESEYKNLSFKQGQIYRYFFRAPQGATHAEIVLKCDQLTKDSKDHSPLFYIQTFTLGSFRTVYDSVNEEAYRLNNTNELKHLCKVQANKVLQLSIAKNWSNIGHVLASFKIKFRGLYPKNSHEVYCLSGQPCKLEVSSFLANEDCEISVSYKHHIQPLKPVETQIETVKPALGLIKPIFQIILTYHFHQAKTDDVGCEVPLLSHQLYENEFQSMFFMVYESHTKRYIFSGDAFPVIYKYTKSLEKGDYTIRLFIRHEKMDTLEKLKDTIILLRRSISSLSQDVYTSYSNVLKNSGKKTSPERIQKEAERVFYLASIPEDKLPKNVSHGHYLSGELTFFKDSAVSKVDKHRIFYQINTHGSVGGKKSSGAASTSGKEKSPSPVSSTTKSGEESKSDDKLREAIRDVQVAHILKSNEIFDSLVKEYPDHVPVYINRIQYLDQQLNSGSVTDIEKKNIYDEIIGLTTTALTKINQNDLLKFLGEKHHDPALDESKKEYDQQKGWVIELLVHQGVALIERQLLEKSETDSGIKSIVLSEELRRVYRGLQKWIDINDEKVSKFIIKFYMHQRYFGKCLKLLFKQLEDKSASKSIDQTILNILDEMSLKHARKYLANSLIIKYPTKLANF